MKRDYANELDLLRFLAALAVTIFHLVPRTIASYGITPVTFPPLLGIAKYGYMGVDLFFMISGFVVIASAQSGSLRSFVVGRITRLYPAFWLACTFTFVAKLAIGSAPGMSLATYAANMTMYPRAFSHSYIDVVYWTLALELNFYALVACVILFGQIRNSERWMTGWLIATLLLAIFPVPMLNSKLLVNFSSYFIAGAMFQSIRTHGVSGMRLVVIAACLFLSMDHAIQTAIATPPETLLYANRSPVVVCAATLVFYAVFFAISIRGTGAFGRMRWAALGVLTYPLYLVHFTICVLVITYWKPALPAQLVFWLTIVISLIVGYLVHRFVEVPIAPRLRNLLSAARRKPDELAVRAQ